MVDGPVRPLPQEVVLPRGPAGAPARGNGSGTSPPVEDMGFPLGLTPPSAVGSSNTSAYRGARREPIGPLPTTGGAPGPGPGCAAHGGPQAHRHPAPGQQAREVRQEAGFSGSTSPRGSGPVPTPWAPPFAGPFLPRPVRQATTPTHTRTMPGPIDGAQGSGAYRGQQSAARLSGGGGAPAVRTPSVDPDPVGPAVGAPAPPHTSRGAPT